MVPPSSLCIFLLAEHKTLKKSLTQCKHCLSTNKTLVCYQQYYTESKTQHCISYWKELNSIPSEIRPAFYVHWCRDTLVGLLTVTLLEKYTIFEPLATTWATKSFTQSPSSTRQGMKIKWIMVQTEESPITLTDKLDFGKIHLMIANWHENKTVSNKAKTTSPSPSFLSKFSIGHDSSLSSQT